MDDGLSGNEAGFINTDACFVAHTDNFAAFEILGRIHRTFSQRFDVDHIFRHPAIDGYHHHSLGPSHAEVHRLGAHIGAFKGRIGLKGHGVRSVVSKGRAGLPHKFVMVGVAG